jgi:hypothetical protein
LAGGKIGLRKIFDEKIKLSSGILPAENPDLDPNFPEGGGS